MVVYIAVIDRPDGLIISLVDDDILHDLPGGDFGSQPAAVHFRREGLAEDKILHDRRRIAPFHDQISVRIGNGPQPDSRTLQNREIFLHP